MGMQIKFEDEVIEGLDVLTSGLGDVAEKALKAGAEVLYESVLTQLSHSIGGVEDVISRSTGELEKSLGISSMDISYTGQYNVKVGFAEPYKLAGEARGGRINALIANVLEYGKKEANQLPRPWLKPAVENSSDKVKTAMAEKWKSELEKLRG